MALQGDNLPPFTRVKIQKRYTGQSDVEEVSDRWKENYDRLLNQLHEKGYDPAECDLQPTSDSYLLIAPDGAKIAEVKRALFNLDEKRKIITCNFYYRILVNEDNDTPEPDNSLLP